MRIYSNRLNEFHVGIAFRKARDLHNQDMWIDEMRSFRPRKDGWLYGTEVFALSNHGTRPTGHRAVGSYPLDGVERAASWTAWGWVIAYLYSQDPDARVGWYRSKQDFIDRVKTSHRKEDTSFLSLVEDNG